VLLEHQEAFETFHTENPHVYEELKERALALKRAGASHGGIGQLFEVLRYDYAIRTHGGEFKLNNNYRAFYARVLMAECAELEGFFSTRNQWGGEYSPDLVRLSLRKRAPRERRRPRRRFRD